MLHGKKLGNKKRPLCAKGGGRESNQYRCKGMNLAQCTQRSLVYKFDSRAQV